MTTAQQTLDELAASTEKLAPDGEPFNEPSHTGCSYLNKAALLADLERAAQHGLSWRAVVDRLSGTNTSLWSDPCAIAK